MDNVSFDQCSLDRLEFEDTPPEFDVESDEHSLPRAVAFVGGGEAFEDRVYFSPDSIRGALKARGWKFTDTDMEEIEPPDEQNTISPDLRIALRGLKLFLRSTGVNENTFRLKLGRSGGEFFDKALPALLEAGVLEALKYKGAGVQSRYRLAANLQGIEAAKVHCDGSLQSFLAVLSG